MKQEDGRVTVSPLKNSRRFSPNTSRSISAALPVELQMKRRNDEFLPGDLVFAEFPGYSWPALVTQVGAKTLEVVTLVLEQDELIDKSNAVIFQGLDQLRKIMSILTPGEQQDFTDASNSLMELSEKSRQERLDIIKTGRSDSDEGESCKENDISLTEKESPVTNIPKPKPNISPREVPDVDSNGVKEVGKLSCDVDDITLPIVGSRLEKIIDQPCPKLTLQVGIPNFGTLETHTAASSEGESEVEVKLQKSSASLVLSENDITASKIKNKIKKLQVKQQRDEDFIANAVKMTNKLFESGAPSVELFPGHQLSYDSLKVARERAMAIAGCASPIISRTRRRSSSKSTESAILSPESAAAKAHAEHLKATRAAQKKALKTIGKPLEIVQTTIKNPAKRPGRKSSNVLTSMAAEIAFKDAAEKLVADTQKITNNAADPDKILEVAASEAARELVSPCQTDNSSNMKSPVRKRRHSKRNSCAENNSIGEIIVNSKSVLEIQKTLSPQKIVSPSVVKQSEEERSKSIRARRCESLKKAREMKVKKVAERKAQLVTSIKVTSPAKKSPKRLSKSPSTSLTSPKLTVEPPQLSEPARASRSARSKRTRELKKRLEESMSAPSQSSEVDRPLISQSPAKSSNDENSEIEKSATSTRGRRKSQRSKSAVKEPTSHYFEEEVVLQKETRSSRRRQQSALTEDSVVKKEEPIVETKMEEKCKCESLETDDTSSIAVKSNPADEPGSSSNSESCSSETLHDSKPLSTIAQDPVEEPNGSNNDMISFLCPYYLNLFTDVIKDKVENQIKLDLAKLPQEEHELIKQLVEGRNRSARKQAYEIISKLVKSSACQNLLTPSLPEVGPGTPPASPKTEAQRISNKVIPQTRKRNSQSNSQDVLHNPFPIETSQLDNKSRMKYKESGDITKKHSVIPRSWSQYLKNNGRFQTEQSKSLSVADKIKSPPGKNPNKRKKTDSPASTKKEKKISIDLPLDKRTTALLLYVKDIQLSLAEPLKLKQSEVKWKDLSPDAQTKYIALCDKLHNLSAEDKTLECTALDLFVKSSSNISRLDWLSLSPTKQKKFLRDAKKVNQKVAASLEETNQFSEKLVTKLVNSESRKRKRESQPADTDSEPSSKKEKADDTLLDFFCLDCFTLDYNPKQYTTCHGCHGSFHKTCLESQCKPDNKQRYFCKECQEGPVCLLCRKGGNLKACSQCPYKYHESCVTPHMSTQLISSTSFICPYHVCGSCEARPELNIKNFVRCVRCPQSFHHNHIPAGCMRISRSHILCFRHHQGFGKNSKAIETGDQKVKRKRKSGTLSLNKKKSTKKLMHLNVPFCFQCTFGGDLICCEGCPASFHNECVPEENQIKEGEVSWLCPDCIVGKKPFIGDIVWVKFGAYRWWPCQILDELDLPDNIFSKPHKPCQFPAICLGTREFAWLDMSRVYSYEDGDKGSVSGSMSASFKLAIIEAKDLHSVVKPMKETLLQETSSIDRPSTKKPAPFKFIKINTPYNSAMKEYEKQLKLERMPFTCDCTMADKCSAESSCINRVLLTECPPECKWSEQCENQRFQRRQYPATKLVKTEGRGWGLIVEEDVTQGSLVIEYVGEIIDELEVQNRLQHYQASGITDYYMLTVENSRIIDAKPKANRARFMNHSCDPNCETQKWNVLGLTCIGLFAKRDIKSGEELTFDYQFDTRGQEKKACLCGSSNCSGFLGVPAKKMVEPSNKEPKKKTKKKRRKKTTKEVKPDLPSTPQEKMNGDQVKSDMATSNTASKSKPSKKIKKAPSLAVKASLKQAQSKGVKKSTKRALKNTILSKKRTRAEENDIEDDLKKIKEIVGNVESEECCGEQKEDADK